MRVGLHAALAFLCAPLAACAQPADITAPNACAYGAEGRAIETACFSAPSSIYPHAVFGSSEHFTTLTVKHGGEEFALTLPEGRVFEDLTPRLWDLEKDGVVEIGVVESAAGEGAALALYQLRGEQLVKVASTQPIGRSNRWLAPIGLVDFDNDGRQEIAYVETPHLAGVLKIVSLEGERLEIARAENGQLLAKPGFSNHRYGEPVIRGGVRICSAAQQLILADSRWRAILAVEIASDGFSIQEITQEISNQAFDNAGKCP